MDDRKCHDGKLRHLPYNFAMNIARYDMEVVSMDRKHRVAVTMYRQMEPERSRPKLPGRNQE